MALLLEGESGTGKSYLARRVHEWSPRAARSFSAVSLAELDDAIASSDLFGHVAGAFTDARHSRAGHFQTANGGTLFLDEIGKASPSVQKKLLGVIETGEFRPVGSDRSVRVDVRLVFAHNVPIASLVERGTFLPDLYARISTFQVEIPPLRERPEDIPALVQHFLARYAPRCGYPDGPPRVAPSLMDALAHAPWQLNVRELEGAVQLLLVEGAGSAELTLEYCEGKLRHLRTIVRDLGGGLTRERAAAAVRSHGTKVAAARALGIARTTLDRYLGQHQSEVEASDRVEEGASAAAV
jgi:DNA-binding NtrC family response regulator